MLQLINNQLNETGLFPDLGQIFLKNRLIICIKQVSSVFYELTESFRLHEGF